MRIGIVGGGPAGLYYALLMKKHDPRHDIRVLEQNPRGATYGWGVVFSERALAFLADSDPECYAGIERSLQTWPDQAIGHQGELVRIDGYGYSGIARLELLRILQEHCERAGVELQFETRLGDLHQLDDRDLIVGADGANSVVRELGRACFQPSETLLANKYVWYGTTQVFDALTLTFRETRDGAFVAHHYRYGDQASTFIVECDPETWHRAGLSGLTEDESRQYCEEVFAAELGGHPLLTNRSSWLNFKVVTNQHWTHDNVVLIGDALRTVHFSIGSGTRMALEDAVALYRACAAHPRPAEALQVFEMTRRPLVDKFLEIATRSYQWYENFRDKLYLDPFPFAHDYLIRSGRIGPAGLTARSPRFVAAYEAFLASRAGEHGHRRP